MKNIKIGIYCIKNKLNNRCYIGQSNDIYKRWCQHKAALKEGKANGKLQIDWDKYGENSFDFLILEELPDDKYELEKRESYYAYTYDVWNEGYNISKLLDYRNFNDADIIHHKEQLLKLFSKNPLGKYAFKTVYEKLFLSSYQLAIIFKNLTEDEMKEYSIYLKLNLEFSYENEHTCIECITWEKHQEHLKEIQAVYLSFKL